MEFNSDLRQRHLKQMMIEIKRRQPEEWETRMELPLPVYYDIFIKSAIAAGWVTGLTEEEVDDFKWEQTVEVGTKLIEMQNEATDIEKN